MGMQEREMLTHPKEGTDDTVVHPVNLTMLYLAITLLNLLLSKGAQTRVVTETTVSLQKRSMNGSNWTGPNVYICTLKLQMNNECTHLAKRRLVYSCSTLVSRVCEFLV